MEFFLRLALETVELLRPMHSNIYKSKSDSSAEEDDTDYMQVLTYWRFHAKLTILQLMTGILSNSNNS